MITSKFTGEVRWGILGAANIARAQFLPGLREAGGGRAVLVASRDRGRAEVFARDNGVDQGVEGYDVVVGSPDIDAVYIALPNSHHARWTQRALETGKAVLCEKPLCVGSAQTAAVLETAATTGALLWESFVFPFQDQHRRLVDLLAGGAIGEVCELVSPFSFDLSRSEDIRLSRELGGGAIADVGCYPIRLAQEVLSTRDLSTGDVVGFGTGNGAVETEAVAIIDYGRQRLVLSCGFGRAVDTFTRVLGTEGQIHLSNPFHPGPGDTLILRHGGQETVERPTVDARSFTAALRHIHAVLREDEAPAHLAEESSLRTALAIEAVVQACSGASPLAGRRGRPARDQWDRPSEAPA
jgi:predicted dehydrogenase